jgi:hypothetical protein
LSFILCKETVAVCAENYTKETHNIVSHFYCVGKKITLCYDSYGKKHNTLSHLYRVGGKTAHFYEKCTKQIHFVGKLKCKYSYYGTSYIMVSTVFQKARVLKFNGEMGSLYFG